MGKKHEKGTPKDLANRTKSKGLQKLRFFCQMCSKQCRDANGYKCHLSSESHQRQLLLVAEDTDKYVSQFSRQFEQNFLQILKNEFGTKRVLANDVYQEIIREKGHIHMNATRWHSLGAFVQHLGEINKCKIDQVDEKGWFIQLIDTEASLKKEEAERKQKAEKDDEERQLELINAQVERARELMGDQPEYMPTELLRTDDNEKIELNLNKKPTLEELNKPMLGVSVFDKMAKVKKEEAKEHKDRRRSKSRSRSRSRDRKERARKRDRRSRSRSRDRRDDRKSSKKDERPRKSALEEIKEMNEKKKESSNRKDFWMQPGIVVKIITKKLGDDYYKAKGVVKTMIDNYTANVKVENLDGKSVNVKLDQNYCETVIPGLGREMLIVNGAYRGCKAILESIDQDSEKLNLTISAGASNGRSIRVNYEDASKLA